jgi:hypothetical protein
MNDLMKEVTEEFLANKRLIRTLEECNTTEIGSCTTCFENSLPVFKVFDMKLCDHCACKIHEYLNENCGILDINYQNAHTLVNEGVVFFDMKKVEDEAKKSYGGDMKALFRNYGLNVYKFYPDKVDFQTFTAKTRINQCMIDFDGEYATSAFAMKAKPDPDGTMALIKVRGQGIVTQHSTQTAPTTIQTPSQTAPPKPTVPTINLKPLIVDFYLINAKGTAEKIDETPSNYTFKIIGVFGAKDTNYILPKSDVNGNLEQAVYNLIADNLFSITNKVYKAVYSFPLYNESFDCILDVESIKKSGKLKYTVDWANSYLPLPKGKGVLDIEINTKTNVEDTLRGQADLLLSELDLIPNNFKIHIADVIADCVFLKFLGDKYAFKVDKMFDIVVDIEKYHKSHDILNYALEQSIGEYGVSQVYNITTQDPNTQKDINFEASLVRGCTLKVKAPLIFNVKAKSSAIPEFEVELYSVKDVRNNITKEIMKNLNSASGNNIDVSQAKKEILTSKASPTKEMMLNKIAKYLQKLYCPVDTIFDVVDMPLRGGTIQEILIKVTKAREGEDAYTTDDAVNEFRDKVDMSFGKFKRDIKDYGMDAGGDPYIVLSLIDRILIDNVVKEFKLDEFFNLKKIANLSYLVESLKRT